MSDILQIADAVLKVSVVAFMAGNLLAIGLETDLKAALAPLRDMRFVVTATLLDCAVLPGLCLADHAAAADRASPTPSACC